MVNFQPLEKPPRDISWVNCIREPIAGDSYLNNAEDVFLKAKQGLFPDINTLPFRNDKIFIAGQLHDHISEWKMVLESSPMRSEILD